MNLNLKLYNITLSCNPPSVDSLEKIKTFFEKNTKLNTEYSIAKKTIQNFNIRKKSKIGFFIKLWGKKAREFLDNIIDIKVKEKSLNPKGVITFAIREYTSLKHVNYNPDLPMFGFTINIRVHRPGLGAYYKIKSKIKDVTIEDLKNFLINNFSNSTIII